MVERRYAPRPLTPPRPSLDADARGTNYSLQQARTMLRQGYHVNKVVSRTGWGRNWFSDMVDETGFVKTSATFDATAI